MGRGILRLLAFVLLLGIVCTFAACASSVEEPTPESDPAPTPTPPQQAIDPLYQALVQPIGEMPENIAPDSPEDEVIRYIVIRGGYDLFNGIAYPFTADVSAENLGSYDQDLLFRIVHFYIDARYRSEYMSGDRLIPTETAKLNSYTTRTVYDADDISAVVEDMFGIKNYIIRCPWYDAANHRYVADLPEIGDITPIPQIKDLTWADENTLTFTWVNTSHDNTLHSTYDVTMTRVNGKMVFTYMDYTKY